MSAILVLLLVPGFVMIAGLVFDGGNALAAKRRANDEAQAAARVGAAAISAADRAGAGFRLDAPSAVAASQGYLFQTGHTGQIQVNGNEVIVTVEIHSSNQLLPGGFDLVGTGSAHPVRGVRSAAP